MVVTNVNDLYAALAINDYKSKDQSELIVESHAEASLAFARDLLRRRDFTRRRSLSSSAAAISAITSKKRSTTTGGRPFRFGPSSSVYSLSKSRSEMTMFTGATKSIDQVGWKFMGSMKVGRSRVFESSFVYRG